METRPSHNNLDGAAPSSTAILVPGMASVDNPETGHSNGVPEPHQVTESHGEIYQGDASPNEQLLSENCQNALALNNLLNTVDNALINNSNSTDQDDELDAAETASMVSALSTEEFHVDLHSDLRTALGAIPPSSGVKKRDEQRSLNCKNPELVDVNEELYYLMDDISAEESLSDGLKALKGSDLAIMECLDKLADELGFNVYIFRAEKVESGIVASSDDDHREGYYDQYGDWNSMGDEEDDEDEDEDEDAENEDETAHVMEEVLEMELNINKLVDLTGREMNYEPEIDVDIIRENLINLEDPFEDPFDRADCEETDYEHSYHGPSATHRYRRTMAVLVPKQHVDRYFSGVDDPDPKTREMALKMTRILAMKSWEGPEAVNSVNPKVVSMVLEVLQRCQPTLFEEVLNWLLKRTDESTFCALKSLVVEGNLKFDQARECMLRYIPIQRLAEQGLILSALVQDCGLTVDGNARESFFSEVLESAVEKSKTAVVVEEDGVAIVNMIQEFCNFDFFSQHVIPLLELRASQGSPFALAAVQQYWIHASTGQFGGRNIATQHCKRLAKSFIAGVSLFRLRSTITYQDNWGREPSDRFVEKSSYLHVLRRYTAVPPRDLSYVIDPQSLVKFFATCLENHWDDLLLQLTFKILAEAERLPWYEYRGLWLPFLQSLIAVLEANKVPLTTPRYQQIAGAILDSFLDNYVQKKPERTGTTTTTSSRTTSNRQELYRQPVKCRCQDCHLLKTFLTSTTVTSTKYSLPSTRLEHIRRQIERTDGVNLGLQKTWPGIPNPYQLDVWKAADFCPTVPAPPPAAAEVPASNGPMTTNDRERLAWTRRAKVAKNELDKFSQGKLKLLLGGDGLDGGEQLAKMRDMAHLRNKTQSKEGQHLQSLMSASSSGGGPLAPMAINSLLGPNSGSGSGGRKAGVPNPAAVAGVRRARTDDEEHNLFSSNSRRRVS
ncbi:hypothetical protein QBC37DRAFT_371660 [Rhypophila decipiens]|uniref:Uncharacterized protein n=1 Tax=Rhypophila decipiens TaxID=261697 RepID=A0AAN7B9R8_9PEZI|nr:hypothetical protein QBC37DRAFT_371660 [Rhypophila decipiens]